MLLNRLAHRGMPPKAKLSGFVYIKVSTVDMTLIRDTSSYVEQEDHLIGSITAKETLRFAARLGLKEYVSSLHKTIFANVSGDSQLPR
jgi:ABC-type multidrug transport system ATPase subunit